jgi:hypothetical protein
MKHMLVGSILAVGAALAQAGTVEVRFMDPDRFSDGGRYVGEAEHVRADLAAHLGKLAARQLPVDQTLLVEVLDIDLAGEPRVNARLDDPRVIRGHADVPRISLRYTLKSGDQVLASGQDALVDLAYMDSSLVLTSVESLPYEKRMLTRWFAQRFPAASH